MKANFVNKLIEKFSASVKDAMVESLDTTETLEQITLEDGTILEYDTLEVGKDVLVVNGEEKTPAIDGEYILPDGKKINVIEGKITEIEEAEMETEPEEIVAEQETQSELSLDTTSITESIKAIDLSKDAEYYLALSVKDGKISWGAITPTETVATEIEMSKEASFNETLSIEKENLRKEFKIKLDEFIEKLSKKKEESINEMINENVNKTNSEIIRERLGRKKLSK